jgi:DNA-binding NarL/FixJ family response regulator
LTKTKIDIKKVNEIVYPDYFQPRQWDILKLKLLGYTGLETGIELGIAEGTVHDKWTAIRQILGISGPGRQKELIQWAIDNGLIEINF